MNYIKATNFYLKDSLVTGDPAKIIRGTEVDAEFNAIATSILSKADLVSPALSGTPTAPTPTLGDNSNRLATTSFVLNNSVPAGGIILWSGSTAAVPTGFLLCDGTSGTPDLRNRFIVGAGGSYAVDAVGGSKDSVVVTHTHTVNDSGHNHTTPLPTQWAVGGSGLVTFSSGAADGASGFSGVSDTKTTGVTLTSSGVSGTDANLPPYYALAYIMKT